MFQIDFFFELIYFIKIHILHWICVKLFIFNTQMFFSKKKSSSEGYPIFAQDYAWFPIYWNWIGLQFWLGSTQHKPIITDRPFQIRRLKKGEKICGTTDCDHNKEVSEASKDQIIYLHITLLYTKSNDMLKFIHIDR